MKMKTIYLMLVLMFSVSAFGQPTFNNAGGDHLWSNHANWDSNAVPGPNSYPIIGDNMECILDMDASVQTLTMNPNSSLTVNMSLHVLQGVTSYGAVIIENGGYLLVGTNYQNSTYLSGIGTILIQSGGKLKVDYTLQIHYPENTVTVNPGGVLVATDITGVANSFTLNILTDAIESASLIYTSNTSNPAATIEFYIPGGGNHLITPFFDGATALEYYDENNDTWLSSHDETVSANNGWSYITELSTVLERGKGYTCWPTNATTITFTGTLSISDVTKTITKTGSGSYSGFNLLGNPFTAPLDWNNGTWTGKTNTSGVVYIWDESADNGNGAYLINGGGTTATFDGIIPMGQGFFVESTSASTSLTIPADSRLESNNALYKSTDDEEPGMFVRFDLKGTDIQRTTFIGFPDDENGGIEYAKDASVLFSSTDRPEIYTKEQERKLIINACDPLEEGENRIVPLYLVQLIDGDYSLTLSDLDQLLNTKITLEDLKTGTTQNMNENPVYTFTAADSDVPNRFNVHFTYSQNAVEEGEVVNDNIQIYSYGKEIFIRSNNHAASQNGMVFVYDLEGRKLLEQPISRGALAKVNVKLTTGFLLVKVIKEGSVKTQKVFIN